eukprot:COSAG02_NODE_1142_length_14267_cov_4.941700_10_plen_131_part_00
MTISDDGENRRHAGLDPGCPHAPSRVRWVRKTSQGQDSNTKFITNTEPRLESHHENSESWGIPKHVDLLHQNWDRLMRQMNKIDDGIRNENNSVSGWSAECAALISEFYVLHKNPTQPVRKRLSGSVSEA